MCNFPSYTLVSEMRRVAREADETNDPAKIAYAANYVKCTNELRLAHEDVSGCQCWYEAIKQPDVCEPQHATHWQEKD